MEPTTSEQIKEALRTFTTSQEFKEAVKKGAEESISGAFTERRLADTPTDSLQVVNRAFVTDNGTSSLRPTSPVQGQFYLDTTIGKPIWYYNGGWIKADGTAA